jgi:gamma-glutamyltranspeptidase/glutathione hydrolase
MLRAGEPLVQRDLAATLERIAREGAGAFCDGEIAEAIGRDFEANGGLFTVEDLRWFRPVTEAPLHGRYRGLTILTDEPPGLGVILIQILQALERTDLRALGWNTPDYLDFVAKTMQSVFASAAQDLTITRAAPAAGTTHLAVVDQARNVVSWVHSSGNGSGVVTPGLGFVHNDHMVLFNPRPGRPDSIAPRAVPVHGGGPVIMMRGERPFMAIGSPAGALKTTAIAQVLLGVVEFGLPVQAAISSPRIHTQHEAGVVMVEPSFPSGLRNALERRGHRIIVSDYTARVSAVMITDAGVLVGGTDPRGGGGLEWC